MFPKDKTGFTIDDQYYIGSSGLLVKPVTAKGATSSDVYLAEDQASRCLFYDMWGCQLIDIIFFLPYSTFNIKLKL